MNWDAINAFLAQHGIVPLVTVALLVSALAWKIIRPVAVDFRAFLIELMAILRALAIYKAGLTADQIAAERKTSAEIMPDLPAADTGGVLGKILGVQSKA